MKIYIENIDNKRVMEVKRTIREVIKNIHKNFPHLPIPKNSITIFFDYDLNISGQFNWAITGRERIEIHPAFIVKNNSFKATIAHEYIHLLDYYKYGRWDTCYAHKSVNAINYYENYFEHKAEGIAMLLYPIKKNLYLKAIKHITFIKFPKKGG